MIHSYPWYFDDWFTSEARLTLNLEERGLYRELLDWHYRDGSLPADESLLKRKASVSEKEWRRSWPRVREQFDDRGGRLIHKRVSFEREQLEVWHDQKREAGKKSAEARSRRRNYRNENTTTVATDLLSPVETESERTFNGRSSSVDVLLEPSASSTTTTTTTGGTRARTALPPVGVPQSLVEPWDQLRGWFIGPVEPDAWRTLIECCNTPERITALLENGPLWMRERRYSDGFHSARSFLKSGVWMQPPKEQAGTEPMGSFDQMVARAKAEKAKQAKAASA